MKDLGSRVGVAAVGIPAILALLYVGGWVLAVPIAVLSALGAGEVYALAERRGARPLSWLGMPAAAALTLVAVLRPDFLSMAPWALSCLFVLAVVTLTVSLWARGPKGTPLGSTSVTVFGAMYAGLPLAFVPLLHALPTRVAWGASETSPWTGALVVLLPIASTWVGDAAAYFAGTWWGKAKLFPSISPAKSWVGAWAGVLGAAAAGVGWSLAAQRLLPQMPAAGVGTMAALGALLGVGAILGDLVESLLKREAGVKDSGRLFRGHGGVLDRLDALTFTLPMAYALLWITEVVR